VNSAAIAAASGKRETAVLTSGSLRRHQDFPVSSPIFLPDL
jgi:hypothetical protein